MVTRLAAVAAVAPIAAPIAAPSTLPSAWLPALSFRDGTTLSLFAALYQVSELFEITLVSDGGTPAASSATTTRSASIYESYKRQMVINMTRSLCVESGGSAAARRDKSNVAGCFLSSLTPAAR
jgi:hypothetical protein